MKSTSGGSRVSLHGLLLFLGLAVLGFQLGNALIRFKAFERTVTVKGLSEREVPADIVIWPIQFTEAANNLQTLYGEIDQGSEQLRLFLTGNGLRDEEISLGAPAITDKSAQQYGNSGGAAYRYVAQQVVTVYSSRVDEVRSLMGRLSELGREGLVLGGDNYMAQTEYIFTGLNELKPEMVEEATREARAVAEKFAEDSDSRLGKIRRASQGQFSIQSRDRNNPHIKKVRVVSTIEYYLSD